MDDAAEPLGPILVFSKKHQPVATGLFPLLAKIERQHAEGRGRRDRGTRRFSFLGRAFADRTAGADLRSNFHETSIVVREIKLCESPKTTRYPIRGGLNVKRNQIKIRATLLDLLWLCI